MLVNWFGGWSVTPCSNLTWSIRHASVFVVLCCFCGNCHVLSYSDSSCCVILNTNDVLKESNTTLQCIVWQILKCCVCIAHAGSYGTRRRTGGEVKGKYANGVGSQSSCIHTPHSSTASSWLNWPTRRLKWTRPFRRKANSGFCACAVTFRVGSTTNCKHSLVLLRMG